MDMAIKETSTAIREWFAKNAWHFDEQKLDGGKVVFYTGVAAEPPAFKGYDISIICREKDVQSVFYPPVKAPPKRYAAVAEYLMRVNDLFRIGKWTLDYADGEICFAVIKDNEAMVAEPDEAMDDLIGFPKDVCDGYAEGIAQVLTGAKAPEQAYKESVARDDADGADESTPPPSAKPSRGQGMKRGGTKRGCGVKPSPSKRQTTSALSNALPRCYSLEGLNVEGRVALPDVIAAIRRFKDVRCEDVDAPRMSILLSGAPGTGKTAFAHHIANEVGLKLVTVKASDILGSHIGDTEKQIEKVFAEAKTQEAILFLDEIDGILGNRRYAEHGWEISQTNQLLQCMEEFGGVIIAATNFAISLDEAVMRRFTFKLKLSYLTDKGKTLLFRRYFNSPLTADQQERLSSIDCLTPGDFRTVKEGLYYLPSKQTNDARLDALAAEADAKGRGKIGF